MCRNIVRVRSTLKSADYIVDGGRESKGRFENGKDFSPSIGIEAHDWIRTVKKACLKRMSKLNVHREFHVKWKTTLIKEALR